MITKISRIASNVYRLSEECYNGTHARMPNRSQSTRPWTFVTDLHIRVHLVSMATGVCTVHTITSELPLVYRMIQKHIDAGKATEALKKQHVQSNPQSIKPIGNRCVNPRPTTWQWKRRRPH